MSELLLCQFLPNKTLGFSPYRHVLSAVVPAQTMYRNKSIALPVENHNVGCYAKLFTSGEGIATIFFF